MNDRQFKTEDAASYDPVGAEFDTFVDMLTPPLARKMVALANLSPSASVLDIGTGNGIVAMEAASHVAEGQVVGIDLSEQMIQRATGRASDRGLAHVQFQVMDAEALTFDAEAFDTVMSLFALLHFPNPDQALREMYRVLKPGGTLVLAVGSSPHLTSLNGIKHRLLMLFFYALYKLQRVLIAPFILDALVRRHETGVADMQEQSALASKGLNRTGSVPQLIKAAGFVYLTTQWQGHIVSIPTAEDYWNLQRTFSSFSRKRINRMNEAQVQAVRDEFFTLCDKVQARGGKLYYPYGAFYVRAQRPIG